MSFLYHGAANWLAEKMTMYGGSVHFAASMSSLGGSAVLSYKPSIIDLVLILARPSEG